MAFDLKTALTSFAPTLATMLGGPFAGAAVTALEGAMGLNPGAGVDGITQVLQTGGVTPDVMASIRAADQRHAELMGQQGIDLVKINADHEVAMAAGDTAEISAVNKTMQGESASEHWPSYSWRPAIGFSVALAVVLSVLTVFGAYAAAIVWGHAEGLSALPGVLAAVAGIIAVVSPILGIASYFRGKAQADPAVPTVNRG